MLQSNYTARSGIIAQQQRIDIISNNMANLNTNGYKSVRADFKDMLYQTMVRPEQPQDGQNLQRGHGVLLGATMRDFTQGAIKQTDGNLDMLIQGDGFFAVQDPSGEILYTRDGAFGVSVEGGNSTLVTADGLAVLGEGGQPINLGTANPLDVVVMSDGTVFTETKSIVDGETVVNRNEVGKIGVFTFINRQGLEAVSGNRFQPSVNSGEAEAAEAGTYQVKQFMLEAANVDLAGEMTKLIRAQRAFSLASKALTTADQMDAQANQIRG